VVAKSHRRRRLMGTAASLIKSSLRKTFTCCRCSWTSLLARLLCWLRCREVDCHGIANGRTHSIRLTPSSPRLPSAASPSTTRQSASQRPRRTATVMSSADRVQGCIRGRVADGCSPAAVSRGRNPPVSRALMMSTLENRPCCWRPSCHGITAPVSASYAVTWKSAPKVTYSERNIARERSAFKPSENLKKTRRSSCRRGGRQQF
jgi:hypothetical protein